MNKFLASALFALVAVATAANIPNSYNPNNEMETAHLVGDQSQFSDYCIKERDFVLADIKSKDETTALDLLSILDKRSLFAAPSFIQSVQDSVNDDSSETAPKEDVDQFLNSLKGVCEQFKNYAEHHESEFNKFVSEHPGLVELPLQRVNCLTASTVQGLVLNCNFMMQ